MKRIGLILLVLLLTAGLTACVDYSSDSVPTGNSTTESTQHPETTQPSGSDHVHSYIGEVVASTCTEEGYMTHTCACGHSFVDSQVPPAGHSWSQWVTVTEPTEEKTGLQTRVCSVCGAEDSMVLEKVDPSHTHSYGAMPVSATCTEGGFTVYRCACGQEYTDEFTEPLGHQWGQWSYLEDCRVRSCSACGATDTVYSDHTHDYTAETIPATCTEGGYRQYICSCGESYRESESDPLGHTWGQWQVIVEPTTTTEGVKERECQVCGQRETGAVEPLTVENGIVILSFPETIQPGEKATVTIQGRPGVEYTITVYYKSGPATAAGLEPAMADGEGYVSWTWRVSGRTSPGTYEIVISGGGVTQSFYFTILEKDA